MQQVCLHAVCLAEPDADSEAWDAVSAVAVDAGEADTVVLRATRDLEAGTEVLLDYGARSNAELLTTHGFVSHTMSNDVGVELIRASSMALTLYALHNPPRRRLLTIRWIPFPSRCQQGVNRRL